MCQQDVEHLAHGVLLIVDNKGNGHCNPPLYLPCVYANPGTCLFVHLRRDFVHF